MTADDLLLAVPNVSEGRDRAAIDAIAHAFTRAGARVLDVHADPDHHRAVYTLAARPGELARAVLEGAREAVARADLRQHEGRHPRVGALDVAPVVHLEEARRGAAVAEALVLADLLGDELRLPVYLYGALAGGRTRAELRRGGTERSAPDFGPRRPHPTAGVTLVAARPPLVAFNLELAPPATEDDAKRIAAAIREGGPEGLPGVRALGLTLETRGVAQVTTNVEDPRRTPLNQVIEAVRRHAPIAAAELVGLAPRHAFDGFPADLAIRNRRTIEDALGC